MLKTLVTLLLLFCSFNGVGQSSFAVVELFTSEGCSSCPAADELLIRTSKTTSKENKNVYYLAYHVDYWNKLGWKDPYSKFQYTNRQENYSRVLEGKEVYTPQIVINGTDGFVGSNEIKLREGINAALSKQSDHSVEVKKDSISNDTLYLSYKTSDPGVNYFLRFALTESGLTNKIGNGENKGKTLHHDHVVRHFSSLDKISSSGQTKIPLKGTKLSSKHNLVFFIQHKQTMRIVAAGKIGL